MLLTVCVLQQSDVETYLDRVVWGSLSSSFPLSDYGKSGKLKEQRHEICYLSFHLFFSR